MYKFNSSNLTYSSDYDPLWRPDKGDVLLDLRWIYSYCGDIISPFLTEIHVTDIVLEFLIPNIAYAQWKEDLPSPKHHYWFSRDVVECGSGRHASVIIAKRVFELPQYLDLFLEKQGWEWCYACPKSQFNRYNPLLVILDKEFEKEVFTKFQSQSKSSDRSKLQLKLVPEIECAEKLWEQYFATHREKICQTMHLLGQKLINERNYDVLAALGSWIWQHCPVWLPSRLSLSEQIQWHEWASLYSFDSYEYE